MCIRDSLVLQRPGARMVAGHALLRLADQVLHGTALVDELAHHAGQAFDRLGGLDRLHVAADLVVEAPGLLAQLADFAQQPVDEDLERIARLVALAAHAGMTGPRLRQDDGGGAHAARIQPLGQPRLQRLGLPVVLQGLNPPAVDGEESADSVPASYIGVLATPEGKQGLIVASLRHGRTVDLKQVSPLQPPAGQTLFLWTLDAQGQARPVGPIPAGAFVQAPLADTAEKVFAQAVELGVTLEVAGSHGSSSSRLRRARTAATAVASLRCAGVA